MSVTVDQTFVAPLTRSFKNLLWCSFIFVLVSVTAPILIFGPQDKEGSYEGVMISGLVVVLIGLTTLPLILSSTRIDLLDSSVKITTMKFFSTTLHYHEIDSVEVGPTTGIRHGAGLRFMGAGATGYLTGGPSVTFTLTNGSQVTASATASEEVVAAVDKKLGRS